MRPFASLPVSGAAPDPVAFPELVPATLLTTVQWEGGASTNRLAAALEADAGELVQFNLWGLLSSMETPAADRIFVLLAADQIAVARELFTLEPATHYAGVLYLQPTATTVGDGARMHLVATAAGPFTPGDVAGFARALHVENVYVDTGADGDADQWVNLWGTVANPAAGATLVPTIQSDLRFVTQLALEFSEAAIDRYDCGTTNDFIALHSGTGGAVSMLADVTDAADTTQTPFGTCQIVATETGIIVLINAVTGSVRVVVADGSGTFVLDERTPDDALPPNEVHVLTFEFMNRTPGVGATLIDDWRLLIDGEVRISGELAAAATASSGAHTSPLRIGARPGAISFYWEGRMEGLIVARAPLGQALADYFRSRIR